MQVEFLPAGTNVINFGEKGEKFYIIVEGKVGVWVPFDIFKAMLANLNVQIQRQMFQHNRRATLRMNDISVTTSLDPSKQGSRMSLSQSKGPSRESLTRSGRPSRLSVVEHPAKRPSLGA